LPIIPAISKVRPEVFLLSSSRQYPELARSANFRRQSTMRPTLSCLLAAVCLFAFGSAGAQTPAALPYTMTTLAGTSPMAAAAGTQCPNLPAGVVSTDAYGDGCLAVSGIFGAAGRGGVVVDSFANVFVADDVSGVIHMINPTSGIMTKVAGGGVACSGKLDAAGDGCLAATQTVTNAPRGIGADPYGNVLLAGYGDNLLHVVCRAASPLCTSAQIGYMELVAGCSQGTGSNGTGGVGLDNVPAATTSAGTCSTAKGEVDAPRGVTADRYGNVYFADTNSSRTRVVVGPLTSTYFTGNNPIYAALAVYYPSVTAGYMYSVVNATGTSTSTGGTATVLGGACSVTTNGLTYSGTALDTYGDGCPLEFSSVKASSGYTSGAAVDSAGNMVFTDPTHGLRVFYVSGAGAAGAAMTTAIEVNDPGVTPQAGFIYMLAGGGATSLSAKPTLGSSTALSDSTITKVTVTPQGNIFIGDSSKVLFFDMNSGYIRLLLSGTANVTQGSYCNGSSGQTSLSAYSDGCPASESLFSNNNGLGVAADGQGDLYLYDASSNSTGMLVRKILAQGLAAQTLGTPLTQSFEVHFPESASGTVSGATATLSATPDMSAAAPTCTQNGDESVDCIVAVTATPSAAGSRSAALTVTLPAGTWQNSQASIALGGAVSGSVLAVDDASSTLSGVTTPIAPTTVSVFNSIAPAGVAVDGAGNVYAIDANSGSILESVQGASGVAISASLPATASQLAVDQQGDVFAVGSGTPEIEELKVSGAPAAAGTPSAYTAASIAYAPVSGTAAPQAVAVDQVGNLFVADNQGSPASNDIYRLSLTPNTLQTQVTVAAGFANPVSLAVDGSGNVYVADKGAGAVCKLTPGVTGSYSQSTLLSGVTPVAVAVDPAGDVYVQDESSASVLEVPVAGPGTVPVLTGLVSPTGLAVDGKGNLYSADLHNTSITEDVRDALAYNFGTSESTIFSGTLTNAGNLAITGSNPVTNTINFDVQAGASSGCPLSSSILSALTAGQACTLSASLVGAGSGTVADVLSFLPSASAVGSLTLNGTLQGQAIATTTTVSGPAPSSPSYSETGTEATFTVTVTASSGITAPGGTVAVTVDSTITNPTLVASGTSGIATVTITGLTAGPHTISAVYATSGSFTGSNSGTPESFTIAQVPTSLTWTPAASTQQVSAAIGSGTLDAAASPAVPGNYVYTVTPAGGSPMPIDASTYLPIGAYSLSVTFYPDDSTDYASSTAAVPSYTVTKANATASVGASSNVVAQDGTGNFTSLSAALAALPTTGGTIYIKPGTYAGQNAVSYPNVSLRGLGGDPTKVILTAEDGAFSAPFVYPGSGPGNANASGDQGSSTLDVTKSAYIGSQQTAGGMEYTPSNFYAEYLTIQNTYNTDATTTSTYSTASGSCANKGVAQTLQALFNSGTQCNSQALALWIESDQAILNNVNLTSLQDTLYAGSQGCGSTCTPARQYIWQGTITGTVDYVFGDAATVFDHTNFFTAWHGTSSGGTNTIEAQNKKFETGSSNDYLSGYVCNSCTFMSQSTGMTNLYYGRPYGPYSTWIMLNSNVDQVNPVGWIEFSGDSNLPTSTYAEYNTQPYTDPPVGTAPYPATLFGGSVTPTGGNSGAGVTGTRETTSQDPGTLEAGNSIKTQLTAAQADQYYPVTFLSNTVPVQSYSGFTPNWNPVAALANAVNSFAPTGNITLNSYGSSVTILGRPQTPGAGLISTGTYTFMDSLNGGAATTLASGTLDASGEAYLSTSTLATGVHTITMIYGGDANFNGSTSASFTITVPSAPLTPTAIALVVANPSIAYGGTISGSVTVSPQSGAATPAGSVTLISGTTALGSCTLTSGSCAYTVSGLAAGAQSLTASYSGDSTFAASTSAGAIIQVGRALLQVTANNASTIVGGALPALTYSITGFVGSDTQSTAVTGAPALSSTATGTAAAGVYPIAVTTGTLAAANYNFSFTGGYLYITPANQAIPVATGDTRTVTEPTFPAVCQQLTADIASANNDIPDAVDDPNTTPGASTNPDQARIQAALNACSGTGEAVELSVDDAGHDAFLSGPLTMPSNVTLLVDPGVVLFFSRNAQDYDTVPGTHTCGTIDTSSATSSCRPLILIPGTSTNVGIMGYGKLDGRGGDTLINAIPPYQGYSWWGLSAAYASPDSQQNPIFIQIQGGASSITLYKITLRNSPLFHVAFKGNESGFTAWDIKIVTPTTSRNTDGIDPGNVTNGTITRSWISDGDDNVAVGAAGSSSADQAANISITNNHFFAGHGESIGSITEAGVSNILWDGNMSAGNGFAGHGSAISATGKFSGGVNDGNSTGIRIKSGNDRGGLVTNVQYSNECLLDHSLDIQFTPLYDTTPGTLTPNFNNILMQNLIFENDDSGAGTVQFTGAVNGLVVNPLQVTLDNVTFPSALSASTFTTTGTAGTETNAQLTFGPGQVSSNFVSAWDSDFAGSNGDTVTNNISAASLVPPFCSFTYIAPELTGPNGLPQTITYGQNATAIVILTPAVGGAAYPTGTVTLTDALTNNIYTATLSGNTDTIEVPLTGLSVGTHTFTATYSGDSNYQAPAGSTYYTSAGPYTVIVNPGSLTTTSTVLSGVPTTTPYGTTINAVATVSGSNPTGTVQFLVGGGGAEGSYTYATSSLVSGTATASISLPYGTTPYTITAVYSGDTVNAGSTSATSSLTVTAAVTTTSLAASTTTTTLGHPVSVTATVAAVVSSAGTPTGTVSFSYTTENSSTPVSLGSAALTSGSASISADLPIGTDNVTATFASNGSFAGSASAAMTITVNQPIIVPLPASPIALPYTISTLAGGAAASTANTQCAGSTDAYGDGCQANAVDLDLSGQDLRGVTADPFGNVYFTDIADKLIRRVSPNGIITDFAGRVTGTACVPPASTSAQGTGCTPTLVNLSRPRGVSSDAAGNILIADYSGNKVYVVKVADGLMYLVAGTGTAGSTGDGGPAVQAEVDAPRNAWQDAVGNIYIADTSANNVRVVDPEGNIHTFAGTGTNSSSGDGGPATSATISNPQGIMVDANLNVYVTDSGRVRVICVTCGTNSPLDALLGTLGIASPTNGDIYTIAGSGSGATYTGTLPTKSTNVSMSPQKLAMDPAGNLYISDSNGFIWFVDFHTGYIRAIASNAATVCSTAVDAYGNGCPATQAKMGSNGGNGFGMGTDMLGNMYIADSTDWLIRKVSTNLQSPTTAVASTTTQPVELHFAAGDSLAATNGLAYTPDEWSLTTPACTTNADTTTDCLLSSSFTPATPGARSTPLAVNSTQGNTAFLALTGTGMGAGATLDPAGRSSFGSNLSVTGLATDNAGNVYVSDANSKQLLRFTPAAQAQKSSAAGTPLATLTVPGAVAVDGRGYVFVADTAAGTVSQISPAGAVAVLPITFKSPSGLAVDALDNLYVSDSSARSVYEVDPSNGAVRTLPLGTLVSPAGLAIDPSGNLLVADPGAPAVYRFNFSTNTRTTVSTSAIEPSDALTDAAGNLLVADSASILAVPASNNSASFTVVSLAPASLAIDGAGNLYTGQSGGVLKLTRTQGYIQFPAAAASPQTVNMLESGNQTFQATSFTQSDASDYTLAPVTTTDCTLNSSGAGTLAIGGVCALAAAYTPTTYLTTTDTVTFNGNLENAALSTPSEVQLTLTGPAAPPSSAIALGAVSPASPVYGQGVTVSATVTGGSVPPAGSVIFTVDGSTYSAPVANGTASASITGLGAGSHTLSAAYTSSNGYASSSAPQTSFSVAQAPTSIAITASPNPAIQGTADKLTATVTGAGQPGGTVLFTSGSATLCTSTLSGAGGAVCSFTPSASGTLTITAQYRGDTNHLGSSATLALGVYDPAITLQFSNTQLVYPGAANVTVCVSGATKATPSGTVTIDDGATALTTKSLQGNGCAYWYISPGLGAGQHSITAVYSGDKNNPAGTSLPTLLAVSPVPVKMSVSCWNSSFPYGGNYQCTMNVSSKAGSAQGAITYSFDGGAPAAVQLSGGNVGFTLTKPAAGSHSVAISYAQQGNYAAAATQTETFTVTPAPVIVALSPSTWYAKTGTSITFSASVSSWSAGAPSNNGTVSFYDGSTLLAATPVNGSGQASYSTSALSAGSHTITATYAGGTNYASGSTKVTITLVQ
jgi:streptogramin lyase